MFPFPPYAPSLHHNFPTPEQIKLWAEIAAYGGAALFFFFKVYSGYFVVNLSLTIKCGRKHAAAGMDHLAILVNLKKGENGALRLRCAEVRVSCLSRNWTKVEKLIGTGRIEYSKLKVWFVKDGALDWNKTKTFFPVLNLPPGDEAHFACYVEVPTHEPCSIQIVILGNRKYWFKLGQWRASMVSLPV